MKRDKFKLLAVFSLVAGLLVFQACGDDDPVSTDIGGDDQDPVDTDPGVGDAPEIPLLQGVEMDVSYFEENNPTAEEIQENPEAYEAYLTARGMAMGVGTLFSSALDLPGFFLAVASQRDAEYDDGTWIWEFPFTVDGDLVEEDEDFEVDVYIEADVNEASNEINWEFYFSGTGTPYGDVEDFLLIEISTNLDNTSGNLKFFSPENQEVPILNFDWEAEAEDEQTISANIVYTEDEEENGEMQSSTIDYTKSGHDFNIIINDDSVETPIEIDWNDDTLEGSLTDPESIYCWGSNLRMTECN
jgi:hypothetical protein